MEPSRTVILAPAYELRLDQLGEHHTIEVICFRCRRQGFVAPQRLQRRWPGYTRMKDLEWKLRCTGCGNREFNSWTIKSLV